MDVSTRRGRCCRVRNAGRSQRLAAQAGPDPVAADVGPAATRPTHLTAFTLVFHHYRTAWVLTSGIAGACGRRAFPPVPLGARRLGPDHAGVMVGSGLVLALNPTAVVLIAGQSDPRRDLYVDLALQPRGWQPPSRRWTVASCQVCDRPDRDVEHQRGEGCWGRGLPVHARRPERRDRLHAAGRHGTAVAGVDFPVAGLPGRPDRTASRPQSTTQAGLERRGDAADRDPVITAAAALGDMPAGDAPARIVVSGAESAWPSLLAPAESSRQAGPVFQGETRPVERPLEGPLHAGRAGTWPLMIDTRMRQRNARGWRPRGQGESRSSCPNAVAARRIRPVAGVPSLKRHGVVSLGAGGCLVRGGRRVARGRGRRRLGRCRRRRCRGRGIPGRQRRVSAGRRG
jgi:hypothetical protein